MFFFFCKKIPVLGPDNMSRAASVGREPGWPGCHVIAKLIFIAFNKNAEIPAN